ncbi:MAG: ribosomal protein S18-alanine N-acetyltransferase [Lachnospiraceae bacterium]|nr:ribosomal protein S18-alanine N-acetyltransferase [Lachnospiraceae bacterium]MBR5917178.1 ribosomal protein S18-alanine N-acetyltransferase [Lachnospiraceae bacterium]
MNETNVEGIAELEKENFSDGWSLKSLIEEINNPDAYYLAVRDDENNLVIAAAGMIVSIDTADIMNVSVKEEYRRRGLASKLLDALFEEGKKRGVKDFTLEVRENNHAARKLYEKKGFVFEGIRPNFYSNPAEGAAIYWLRG